jgi:hypothetical protein
MWERSHGQNAPSLCDADQRDRLLIESLVSTPSATGKLQLLRRNSPPSVFRQAVIIVRAWLLVGHAIRTAIRGTLVPLPRRPAGFRCLFRCRGCAALRLTSLYGICTFLMSARALFAFEAAVIVRF